MPYTPADIEKKWQEYWDTTHTYRADNDSDLPKYYVLDMFPYPSGAGLHVGHPLGYIASDIYSRYKRLKGFNVLHPMGYDAFGLPAEQYAIQTGIHPHISTSRNINTFKKQMQNLGLSFDWEREINTSDPNYYKWTQWIFLKLYDHYYDIKADKALSINLLQEQIKNHGTDAVSAAHNLKEHVTADQFNAMSAKAQSDVLMAYRLMYREIGTVNWCPELGTVLSNDEVKDGFSERGGHPVVQKELPQWKMRTTAYAPRLLSGLDKVDWPSSLNHMQRNWIGQSEGASVNFRIANHDSIIEIFTTRPDTIYGATFMVIAPELDLVKEITSTDQNSEIEKYLDYVSRRSERDRISEVNKVTGAFTGAYAVHPLTGDRIPIWISEYVLKDYGTGAIMAVPAEDSRDRKFATKFGLSIIEVVDRSDYPDSSVGDKSGRIINSESLNGLEVPDAISSAITLLEKMEIGSGETNYRLRDANFSRQRYWGEPIPISYDETGTPRMGAEDSLPLNLPYTEDFKPQESGRSPLGRLEDWVHHSGLTRETDTMPGFAGSSWYFLRYMDPTNPDALASGEALKYWQDVDLYIGGAEHAVGHLLYSRMWHKFLHDIGIVPTDEPFKKLVNQGMIQGVIETVYLSKEKQDDQHQFVSADLVENPEDYINIPVHVDFVEDYGEQDSYLNKEGILKFIEWRPEYAHACWNYKAGCFSAEDIPSDARIQTKSEVGKMSKRYFNVVNPDVVVDQYGADAFRLYEMFLGPLEQSKPWDSRGLDGTYKFLRRFWSLFFDENEEFLVTEDPPSKDSLKTLHKTIQAVEQDIKRLSLNTCVSHFMICVNELKKQKCHSREILEPLCILLAPFAPYITEELWSKLGHAPSIHKQSYPIFDESHLKEDSITYPVCVNGKKREEKSFPADRTRDDIIANVKEMPEIAKWIEGKEIKKIIVVPGRMINIVV